MLMPPKLLFSIALQRCFVCPDTAYSKEKNPGAKQWRREVLKALLLAHCGQVVRRGMQSLG